MQYCVCVCIKSVCVRVVKAVSVTGVVLADSRVLNSSPFTPYNTHTHTHMHTHITSVPHTTERLCYYDAILFRTDQQLFTATVWNMQTSCQGLGAVNKYLLRLAYFIPVSSFQYWLYPPNNNNSLCDWSQEVIYTVQTQCHSPSNISNSNVMAAYCAVSRWIWKSGILSGWLFFFCSHSPPFSHHHMQ